MREIPGYSKKCKKCFEVKLEEDFDFQKTRPTMRYAYCRPCMTISAVENVNQVRLDILRNKDIKDMRAKAVQMRKLNDNQIAQLKHKRELGASTLELANDYSISTSTVYKILTTGYSNKGLDRQV